MEAHSRSLAGSAAGTLGRCRELAAVSEEERRLTRRFATPAMAQVNALVGRWMAEAGLDVRVDAAGNLVGHLPGTDPDAGTLLLGSHLDTVRDAGAFDGPLGVLAAVDCVERLRADEM
jgi:allantoate deiminase